MGSRGAITQKRGIGILQYAPQIKALWNPKYRIWSKFVEAKMTLENTSVRQTNDYLSVLPRILSMPNSEGDKKISFSKIFT